jgi:hypothetical protein
MKRPELRRVVKRTALCLVACLGLVGGVAAQNEHVTMPSLQPTLKEAIGAIEQQTTFRVAVNWANLDGARVVTLTARTLSVEQLLTQALAETDFTHSTQGRQILIVPSPPPDEGRGAIPAIWRHEEATVDDSVAMEVITFRAGSALPEADFMQNTQVLENIDRSLTDTTVVARLDHISVTAASSPDGNTDANEQLAIARARSTKEYLLRSYPHIAPEMVHTFSVGEEWSGLRRLVELSDRVPSRDEVLALLDGSVADDKLADTLRTIADGRAWRYITARLTPMLRGATAVTLHFRDTLPVRRTDTISVAAAAGIPTTISGVHRVEILAARPTSLPSVRRPLFAVKTNLLFDAVSAVNLEIEIPLSPRWSVAGEAIFPWWMKMDGGVIEGRRWLGDRVKRPRLTGWFIGGYIGGGNYDMRGHASDYYHIGVSGGFAHAVNRRGNLRMEYGASVGYLKANDKYWFGPTRARASLVLILEH